MFEKLKRNIEQERKIVADMRSIQVSMYGDAENQEFYFSSLRLLGEQLFLLNKAVPDLLKEWSPFHDKREEEKGKKEKQETVSMSYVSPSTKEKRYVTISKKDKGEFLETLKMSEGALVGIKKLNEENVSEVILKPSSFARVSNNFFRKYSDRIAPHFGSLGKDLKKGNIRFLMSTYLSMAIMSSVIAFFVGLLFFGALLVIDFGNWIYFFLPFGTVGLTMFLFYFYPASEASSLRRRVSQELPFATIHMAAIAGSDIEPTKIFKIIASSSEYPCVGGEIKKIITQTDVYGYDLVTSLKNVAVRTSNRKLAELFSGLATNINTGGSLENYLEKKAENFLVDYRLERQKYADLAGTFMDVYISILIAAPLVLMMMFIVMNVAGLGLGGLTIDTLLILSVAGIVMVNIIFIIILNFKQPKV
ncbi:MAG: type II secretion system F family protein [archaeon]